MRTLAVGLAMVALGCGGNSGGSAPPSTDLTRPVATPATTAPSRSSSTTSIGGAAGQLTADELAEVNLFMERFLDRVWRGDPEAREMWTGYPESDVLADAAFDRFLDEFEWVRSSDDIGWRVDGSAGFSPMPVVTITDYEGEACAFVVSLGSDSSPVVIQRLPTKDGGDAFDPTPYSTVVPGDLVTVDGVPVEGDARAYLYGSELPVQVDHETQSMSVALPDQLPEVVVLTFTTATPEIPAAVAVVYRT